MHKVKKITEILSADEIKALTRASDLKGCQAVLTSWSMIFGSFYLVHFFPSIVTVAIALILIGGRHLALGILMHDASHDSLFKTKWLNQFVGSWLCAYPTWQDLRRYRHHHWLHHKNAGSIADPDVSLIQAFPISRASLFRKLARDITGLSALKRIYGLLLMDFGFIKYTVASETVWLDQSQMTFVKRVRVAARNLHGVVITNLLLFLILKFLGLDHAYLLWLVSYLATFSVIVRIRSIAEHAGTKMDLDPFKSTRTTYANFLARVTVAPHRVNYHLEHHLLMTAPYFQLPKIHALLCERGALDSAFNSSGYVNVLRDVTTSS